MNKKILRRTQLNFTADFPGLYGVNIMAKDYPIEPFLVFTEFRMNGPVFGPHPHAGISVMTYILPDSKGSFINRDSNGDFSFIEPGGIHITQAGSGIHHDEFPKTKGIEAHGFQIWINHSEKDRMIEPKAMHANADQIVEILKPNQRVRIIHGQYDGKVAFNSMVTEVTLLHVFLEAGSFIQLPAKEMSFVYGLNGEAITDEQKVNAQTLINYEADGDTILITASSNGVEFIFGTATPLNESITYGGPFVMTSPEQMRETQKRYANGKMGYLEPYHG